MRILKNRYGIANASFYFQYYSKFELFIPSTLQTMKDASKELAEKAKLDNGDDEDY